MYIEEQSFSDKETLLEILLDFESATVTRIYEELWLSIIKCDDNSQNADDEFADALRKR